MFVVLILERNQVDHILSHTVLSDSINDVNVTKSQLRIEQTLNQLIPIVTLYRERNLR